jgi:hypothetical protein
MATAVTHTPEHIPTRPAFLDGRPKRMLINGQWVEAASGKTFDSINPSTGKRSPPLRRAMRRTSTAPSPPRVGPLRDRGVSSSPMSGNT